MLTWRAALGVSALLFGLLVQNYFVFAPLLFLFGDRAASLNPNSQQESYSFKLTFIANFILTFL